VTEYAESSAPGRKQKGSWLIGLASFGFILLQSACTAVMAISGLRLLIGLGSLAAASLIPGFILAIHADAIRIPMMIVAVMGSVINLYVVWRIRMLRSKPSAQWRMQPVSSKQRRSETLQIVLAVLTLLLVVVESSIHHHLHGSF
jgi:cytochrome b subunit of formate dehydrogenase